MREASDKAFVSTEMNHGVHKRLEIFWLAEPVLDC
jgi:hypothetical protein